MAEEMISKERIDYTIDLLITMAVEEIAEDTGKSPKEILPEFYSSKTGKALYDEQTRLWCNGPSYIAELYMDENFFLLSGSRRKRTFYLRCCQNTKKISCYLLLQVA